MVPISLTTCNCPAGSEYYHFRQAWIPLRWMPPEAVLEDEFSTKSDVWSFGVLMWEVFTQGEMPYAPLADDEVLAGMRCASCVLPSVLFLGPARPCGGHGAEGPRGGCSSLPMEGIVPPPNIPLAFASLPGLQSGKTKLPQPEGCPSRLAKLMQRCWAPSPKDRPSFSELAAALGDSPADSKA